jgi:hypothetical protein
MSELDSKTEVEMGTARSFGIVFAVVFLIVAAFPLWGGNPPRWWAVGIAGLFVAVALLRPVLLNPLNRLWFRFGLLLNKVVSPIVMGILFFLTVTPTGLIMRVVKGDLLKQKIDPQATSYWIEIDPAQEEASSMRRQF